MEYVVKNMYVLKVTNCYKIATLCNTKNLNFLNQKYFVLRASIKFLKK